MSLKKNFSWNIFGSLAPLTIGIVTIPVLLDRLGIEQFGILTIIWVLIGYFSLFDFGLGRALTQIVSKYSETPEKVSLYSMLTLKILVVFGVLASLLVIFLINLLPISMLGISQENSNEVELSLLIACLGIPLTTLTSGLKGILEGYLKFKESNLLRFYLGIGNFLLPFVVVYYIDASLPYICVSLILTRLVIMYLHLIYVKKLLIWKNYSLSENKSELKILLTFGSWMTVSNVVSPLMVTSDRFIISSVIGASLVAYYTVPFEIVIRALIIPAALTSAFFPIISKLLSQDKKLAKKEYNAKFRIIFLMMLLIFSVFLASSKPLLELWMGEEFAKNSWHLAVILMLGVCFNGMAQLPHALIHASGSAKSVAVAHIVEFIVYIPLLILMIKLYGLNGAAISWLIRAFADFVIMKLISRKVFCLGN